MDIKSTDMGIKELDPHENTTIFEVADQGETNPTGSVLIYGLEHLNIPNRKEKPCKRVPIVSQKSNQIKTSYTKQT